MIRLAEPKDLDAVNSLLRQVLHVHHEGRPDLFRAEGKKYTDDELLAIFRNPDTPVFVYEENGLVLGYAFCALEHQCSGSLKPLTTLYVDDLCVDAAARGRHIGKSLFRHVKSYAIGHGCHNITLHVWECNPGAAAFYAAMGMTPQYTSMELLLD
ncbi:MAG: GNAT family N-acetyltransferase [Bacteroidales bacterium]|nr:GNAT family N-acetyltransferase [Bacteroidales bacterium]